MKKSWKRLLSLILSLALVFTMDLGVFADTVSTGEGTGFVEEVTDQVPSDALPEESGKVQEPDAAGSEAVKDEAALEEGDVSENAAVSENASGEENTVSADEAETSGEDEEEAGAKPKYPAPEKVYWVQESSVNIKEKMGVEGSENGYYGEFYFSKYDPSVWDEQYFWKLEKADDKGEYHLLDSGESMCEANFAEYPYGQCRAFEYEYREAGNYRLSVRVAGDATHSASDWKSVVWNNYSPVETVLEAPSDIQYDTSSKKIKLYTKNQGVNLYYIEYSYVDAGKKKVLHKSVALDSDPQTGDVWLYTLDVDEEAVRRAKEAGADKIYLRASTVCDYMMYYKCPSPMTENYYGPVAFSDLPGVSDIDLTSIDITGNPESLWIGRAGQDSVQLGYEIYPRNVTYRSVSWDSLNPEFATVDQTGRVVAKSPGTATIQVKSVSYPSVVSQCSIEIKKLELNAMHFEKSSYDLYPGQTGFVPRVIFDPADAPAAEKELIWESSQPSVVSWSDTKKCFVAGDAGNAVITAKSKGKPSVSCSASITVSRRGGPVIQSGDLEGLKWTLYESGLLVISKLLENVGYSQVPWADHADRIRYIEFDAECNCSYFQENYFHNLPSLETVKLPDNLKGWSHQSGYFYNCPKLERFYYSGKNLILTDDGSMLIDPGSDGRRVVLGTKNGVEVKDVFRVGPKAYYGQSLPYVILNSTVRYVEDQAFVDCKSMTFAYIGNYELYLDGDSDPFAGCDNLKDVYFAGDSKDWKAIAKKSKVLKSANVHYSASMPEICTVSFVTDGSEVQPMKVIKGNTIASLPVSYKDQYVLEGWYLDKELTKPFTEGTTKVEGDTVLLYAKWREAKQVTVTFYGRKGADGKWEVFDTQTVYEEQFVNAGIPAYADISDAFDGWYTDEKFRTRFDPETTRVKEDMKLYARWSSAERAEGQGELQDGSTLSYSLDYTKDTVYDGRTHVVGDYNGKILAKESLKVNPDIRAENFVVYLNGEELSGITISKFNYKNNKLPSYDGSKGSDIPMFIYPVLKYDKKDEKLKTALNEHKDLKKVLSQMMKPSKIKSGENKGEWNYEPLTVNIARITLDGSVYTTEDLKNDPELQKTDGILVFSGKPVKYTKKKVVVKNDPKDKDDDEVYYYYLKTTVPGLYYQKVYNINGVTKVKKLNLKAGARAYKKKKYSDGDGGFETEITFPMQSTSFDYYVSDPEGSGDIVLNDSDIWYTEDEEGNIKRNSKKLGCFTGSLPSFPVPEEE